MPARRWVDRIDAALAQVLGDAARVVQQAERGLELVDAVAPLRLGKTLVIDASEALHDARVAGLRQERGVVDEPPEGQQTVDAAGVLVPRQRGTGCAMAANSRTVSTSISASRNRETHPVLRAANIQPVQDGPQVRAYTYSVSRIRTVARRNHAQAAASLTRAM